MMNKTINLFFILLNLCSFCYSQLEFPADFKFGAGGASYQIEGAWNEDGKGENIWDYAIHRTNVSIADGSNADIACDSYHKYKEDIQLVKALNLSFYRFSISWSRILPNGTNDYVNKKGIEYYNNVINEALANGLEPLVTIFHWDLPQPLQDQGGFLVDSIVESYMNYSRVLFENFGDRVKLWVTFNEPDQTCEAGYSDGYKAPFLTNSGIWGYNCSYHLLLAHAATYRLYDSEFRSQQKGRIAITVGLGFYAPKNANSTADQEAADTALLINNGYYLHPIVFGNWPQIMIERVQNQSAKEGFPESRLPAFSTEQQELLKGTADFLGVNFYTAALAEWTDDPVGPSKWADTGVTLSSDPSWPVSASGWLQYTPWGIRGILGWIKDTYNNPEVIITENGWSDTPGTLEDRDRGRYYKGYLTELLNAIVLDGCNVTAYTAWCLLDNFEWLAGYAERFGLYYVDFNDPNRTRTRKYSSYVYQHIVTTRQVDLDYDPPWPAPL